MNPLLSLINRTGQHPLLRRLASAAIITAVGYFIIRTLANNWQTVRGYDLTPDPYSLLGLALFTLAVPVTGLLWGRILERLSQHPVNRLEAMRVQIGSWLLKYVPGQVGSFTAKLSWGIKRQYSKKDITVSFIYENILLITSSVLTTLPILAVVALEQIDSNLGKLLPLLIALPLFVVSLQPVFQRGVNLALKILGKSGQKLEAEYFLGFKEVLIQQFKFILPRILNAAGFVLIAASVTHISPSMYLGLGAAYVLAGVIGILAIFVPSGIGVREAIIILFASIYLPVETATLIAVLARFYATMADVLLALVYYTLNRAGGKTV